MLGRKRFCEEHNGLLKKKITASINRVDLSDYDLCDLVVMRNESTFRDDTKPLHFSSFFQHCAFRAKEQCQFNIDLFTEIFNLSRVCQSA